MTIDLPWQPLVTIERSGKPEITLYGIIAVLEPDQNTYPPSGNLLLGLGDIHHPLWSRSLLKPWQLLSHYPVLKKWYPLLQPKHYALMTASHDGDERQLNGLEEISVIGQVSLDALQCPACYPMSPANAQSLKQDEIGPHPVFHPCAGKHLGHLLTAKPNQAMETYLEAGTPLHEPLQETLGFLLERNEFDWTIDGCGLPNLALTALEMAWLFCQLSKPLDVSFLQAAPESVYPILEHWDHLGTIMHSYPELVGGEGRLDTRIMQGQLTERENITLIAKEGADGLLSIGISPTTEHPHGLGILIKLSSGYEPKHLELIATALFEHLGFKAPTEKDTGPLNTRFHFDTSSLEVRCHG